MIEYEQFFVHAGRKHWATLVLLAICFSANGQPSKAMKEEWTRGDSLFSRDGRRLRAPLTDFSYVHVDTEIRYISSTGKIVVIQNSGPRGGNGFTDAGGTKFGYRVFWTRVLNKGAAPLELIINFPADSFALPAHDSYMKVFLHPDTMSPHAEALFDDSRKQFADTTLLKTFSHRPTSLQRTIHPNESCLLYTVVLRHYQGGGVSPRGGFALKQQELFYRIGPEFDNNLIPCGQIAFKN